MDTLMFFYTLAILVICIVTAVLSLAAYASSHRRFFIYGSGVFICYAIEMTEIFFFECLSSKSMAIRQIKACEVVATRVRNAGMVIA